MKNSIEIIFIFFFILITSDGNAQTKDHTIIGTLRHLDTLLPDINILNKTKSLGTSSDQQGRFKMLVSLGDSILFSSVAFQNRTIIVSENHINSRRMDVYLEPGLNELEAIELQQKIRLEVQKIAVPRGAVLDMDEMSSRTPNAELFTNPTSYVGVDFMNIIYGLTTKMRTKKRARKAMNMQIAALKSEFPEKIKLAYGKHFFTDVLRLKSDEIELFLDFCGGNGLTDYYDRPEIEIKDFLFKQVKRFKLVRSDTGN